jgi:hypothetical protein
MVKELVINGIKWDFLDSTIGDLMQIFRKPEGKPYSRFTIFLPWFPAVMAMKQMVK